MEIIYDSAQRVWSKYKRVKYNTLKLWVFSWVFLSFMLLCIVTKGGRLECGEKVVARMHRNVQSFHGRIGWNVWLELSEIQTLMTQCDFSNYERVTVSRTDASTQFHY